MAFYTGGRGRQDTGATHEDSNHTGRTWSWQESIFLSKETLVQPCASGTDRELHRHQPDQLMGSKVLQQRDTLLHCSPLWITSVEDHAPHAGLWRHLDSTAAPERPETTGTCTQNMEEHFQEKSFVIINQASICSLCVITIIWVLLLLLVWL